MGIFEPKPDDLTAKVPRGPKNYVEPELVPKKPRAMKGLKKWVKGQSGNPGGKPAGVKKGDHTFERLASELGLPFLERVLKGEEPGSKGADGLVYRQRAAEYVVDHAYGKAAQRRNKDEKDVLTLFEEMLFKSMPPPQEMPAPTAAIKVQAEQLPPTAPPPEA